VSIGDKEGVHEGPSITDYGQFSLTWTDFAPKMTLEPRTNQPTIQRPTASNNPTNNQPQQPSNNQPTCNQPNQPTKLPFHDQKTFRRRLGVELSNDSAPFCRAVCSFMCATHYGIRTVRTYACYSTDRTGILRMLFVATC
jgi:hypothetical protein